MNSRPKQPKYARNKNVLVIGGSGSGKTRFFVKPNLMQCSAGGSKNGENAIPVSYIVTDPKGTVLVECGKLLQRSGYRIKVLNTINFKKSMHYNPFAYIRNEKDILKLVNTIIANTKGDGEKSGEDFWVKSERLFYCALIGYIWYEAPEDEKNFTTLLEMINASEAREDDPEFQSPVDLMFERLEEKDPEHFAVRQYKKFLLSAGKTRSSILISCGARLAPFDIRELRELLETDEMELDTLGDRKTALFVIISDTDDTFNFIVSILYTQLFNLLCDKADDEYSGRLPVHVRCLLDEFANIGQIPKFEKLIATIRSREISACIILQSQSQLKAIYKDNADTIVGNCDTTLFLGGKEKTTLKEMSELLGKETIDSFNTSETRGREQSHGLNYQKLGKELPDIAVDELTGDVDRFKDFFAALEQASPVPIGFEKIEGGAHGYYHLEEKRIAIDEGMSDLQTLKTAIHEIAHAKLHDIDLNAPKEEQKPRVDRRTREVEAESVAYTVCQHYGLDTSDYSFGYVAGWSGGKELAELRGSLETIRNTAAEMINAIDGHFAELQKAQEKEKAQPQHEGSTPEQPEAAAQEKAAFAPETIYRVRRNPYSDREENAYLLQAYVTQENGRAKMGEVLFRGTPEKCRELLGQLNAGELTEGQVKELYAKAQEQPETGRDDTFSIYQLKDGDETRDYRFEPYDRLQAAGLAVDRANYALVYTAPLVPGTSLDDIFTRFNIDHPKDFKGHSLSVSDVVVLHQDGQDTAHYVDRGDFKQVPEFLQEKQPQLTPDELETGEKIRTPRGTFYVTGMSREQMEAVGYGVHHQSDDGKYLIMGNGTRAFAVAAEQAQRENPLKAAEQTTEQNYNMIDGRINNTPTVDELEAKVKAGETISLVDLANAVKADKERGKAAKPEKKPSIRAQLKADKERAAQKKPAKQKSQDLERS